MICVVMFYKQLDTDNQTSYKLGPKQTVILLDF